MTSRTFGYTALPGSDEDDIATLREELDELKRKVRQLESQSLGRHKIRVAPDGRLIFPGGGRASGIHFKDTALGQGLFWDAENPKASITGFSANSSDQGQLDLRGEDTATTGYGLVRVRGDTDAPQVRLEVDTSSTAVAEAVLYKGMFNLHRIPLELSGMTADPSVFFVTNPLA